MTATAPPFALLDMAGETRRHPTGRPSLIAFVKEDCQTCNLVAPLLEAFHRAWGETADVWVLGQSAEGNAILRDRHGLTLPILDESACRTSFAWGFDIVPAVYWLGPGGEHQVQVEGFVREEWQQLAERIADDLNAPAAPVSWSDLPDWRPGCGSKHLDPGVHDRLAAEAADSPIRRDGSRSPAATTSTSSCSTRGSATAAPGAADARARPAHARRDDALRLRTVVAVVRPTWLRPRSRRSRSTRSWRLPARVPARGHRRGGGGLHRRVQHARRHRDDHGRLAGAGDQRSRSASGSA
jgi:hypothetical protein